LEQPDLGARLVGEQLVVRERAADVRLERAAVALEVEAPRADERAVEGEEDSGHRSVATCVDGPLFHPAVNTWAFVSAVKRAWARARARDMQSSFEVDVAVVREQNTGWGVVRGRGRGCALLTGNGLSVDPAYLWLKRVEC